jgi:hypothetical protein
VVAVVILVKVVVVAVALVLWAIVSVEFLSFSGATLRAKFSGAYWQCVRSGVFEKVLRTLAADLLERGGLDLSECVIDGTFIIAKKMVNVLEGPRGAKVRR